MDFFLGLERSTFGVGSDESVLYLIRGSECQDRIWKRLRRRTGEYTLNSAERRSEVVIF